MRHSLYGCCCLLAISSPESMCYSIHHDLFIIPWITNWYSSMAQQKWSLILFYSTRFIRPIYCLKVHWKFDLVLVAETDSGRKLSTAVDAPYDGPYNSLSLLDLEFQYLQMTSPGLCYWSPYCFMLLKECLVSLPESQPFASLWILASYVRVLLPQNSHHTDLCPRPQLPNWSFATVKWIAQMNISLVSSVLVPIWLLYHQIEVMIARLISSDIDGFFFFFKLFGLKLPTFWLLY